MKKITKILIVTAFFLASTLSAYAKNRTMTDKKLNIKEITLLISNQSPKYSLAINYKIFNGKHVYAQGSFSYFKPKQKQRIFINQIPIKKEVYIQINKIQVSNVTVFNDPCEVTLQPNQLKAEITLAFRGNPQGHGSFNCQVSPKQFPKGGKGMP